MQNSQQEKETMLRQLYMERLSNTISKEDDRFLQNLLDSDEDANNLYRVLETENQELNGSLFAESIEEKDDLANLKALYKKRKRKKIYAYTAVAAATLLFAGIAIMFLSTERDVDIDYVRIEADSSAADKVNLKLTNGEIVVLDKHITDQFLAVGDITLQTSENTLEAVIGDSEGGLNELIVPEKEDYKITLSDGTKVWINSNSDFRFPSDFAGNSREVYIEGEAYFEVTEDSSKPFIVHTRGMDIEVYGTSFNVNSYDKKSVRTSLIEGEVDVLVPNKKPVTLKPGYEAEWDSNSDISVSPFDEKEILAWTKGVLYFHNEPLVKISEIIPRWFGVNVVFESTVVANASITGMLEKEHLTDFLNDLETSMEIQYYYVGDTLYFR